jgi:hypothetical protein
MPIEHQQIPLDDGSGEDYEIEVSRTEGAESYKRRQSKKPSEMHEEDKILLWAELSVLLNPAMSNRVEQKVKASLSQEESHYVGSYIIQHENFILNEMQWKLREHDLKLSNLRVRSWLRFVSTVFKAADATGIDYDAAAIMKEVESLQKQRRKAGRPAKKSFKHPNGKTYKNMTIAAQLDDSRSYAALKQWKYREKQKSNSI